MLQWCKFPCRPIQEFQINVGNPPKQIKNQNNNKKVVTVDSIPFEKIIHIISKQFSHVFFLKDDPTFPPKTWMLLWHQGDFYRPCPCPAQPTLRMTLAAKIWVSSLFPFPQRRWGTPLPCMDTRKTRLKEPQRKHGRGSHAMTDPPG